jgi:hypothetical protein
MKIGKSLSELAVEIERQSAARKDYLADTRKLEMVPPATKEEAPRIVLVNGSRQDLGITELAHRQIGERVGIPAKYYDKMRSEAPDLLAANVNRWFTQNPEPRLVRTLDNNVRAFLSNSYQRIDNNHIAEVVLPVLLETPGIKVVSCEVTETKLYIKAVSEAIQGTVKSKRVGDVVEAGVVISNSEVGLGAVHVSPFAMFLYCMNGMILPKAGMRSAHLGTKLDADENLAKLLAEDTRKAADRAVLLKVRDVVKASMDAEKFNAFLRQLEEQTGQEVKGDPAKAIEVLADDFQLSDSERSGVLRHLIQGGDLSRYGLMNAVTRTAEDMVSYDRATELEAMGGRIVALPSSAWERIAEAA